VDSSNDPDLRDFRDRGAKLIMYHGWSDYFLAPLNTVSYYKDVVQVIASDMSGPGDAVQATQQFARLFMLPGVGHCTGGPGHRPRRLSDAARAVGGAWRSAGPDHRVTPDERRGRQDASALSASASCALFRHRQPD
jgi:hypothetical protein